MAIEKILTEWKKQVFKPVYWFEGEEEYFIDKAVDYAEHHILSESEASFNLSIFYGRDTLRTVASQNAESITTLKGARMSAWISERQDDVTHISLRSDINASLAERRKAATTSVALVDQTLSEVLGNVSRYYSGEFESMSVIDSSAGRIIAA